MYYTIPSILSYELYVIYLYIHTIHHIYTTLCIHSTGLAGYVCTRDISRMWKYAEALEVGIYMCEE